MIPYDLPCIECGYNLRGLPTTGHCPECHHSVRASEAVAGLANRATLAQRARGMLVGIAPLAQAYLAATAIGYLIAFRFIEILPYIIGHLLVFTTTPITLALLALIQRRALSTLIPAIPRHRKNVIRLHHAGLILTGVSLPIIIACLIVRSLLEAGYFGEGPRAPLVLSMLVYHILSTAVAAARFGGALLAHALLRTAIHLYRFSDAQASTTARGLQIATFVSGFVALGLSGLLLGERLLVLVGVDLPLDRMNPIFGLFEFFALVYLPVVMPLVTMRLLALILIRARKRLKQTLNGQRDPQPPEKRAPEASIPR